jgi:putative ABC transport system permease protein
MLRNDLTLALRNLGRNRILGAIKITGLVIGITACLVVFLIASFELSFDRFQPDRDRIFRVYVEETEDKTSWAGAPTAMPAAIRNEISGVESVCNFHTYGATVHVPEGSTVREYDPHNRIILTPPDYFSVFKHYEWVVGTPERALREPFQVVLTESRARIYFGAVSASAMIGREVRYNDSLVVTVSGVVKDVPHKTDLDFTDFISAASIESSWLKKNIQLNSWNSVNSSSQAFIRLMPNILASQIEAQMPRLAELYAEKYNKRAWRFLPRLQPLSDLHFNPVLGIFNHSRPAPERSVLYTLMLVAVLLLVIALINYINLETAQATQRAKEVGVRKTLGSSRGRLIWQFLMQTLMFSACAAIVSPLLAWVALRYFHDFVPPGLTLNLADPLLWFFMLACIVTVTMLAGIYPALVLSSYQPARALKNLAHINTSMNHAAFIRKGLTVFQFVFAQVLIIATMAIGIQIDYMLNKDLGFSSDAVIYFYAPRAEPDSKKLLLRNELGRLSEIETISLSSPPCLMNARGSVIFEKDQEILQHDVALQRGDTTYLDVYDMRLVAGRNFSISDSIRECLINETYMHILGYTDAHDLLGKTLDRKHTIVGVIKDFHARTLHSVIEPIVIYPSFGSCIALKVTTQGNTAALSAALQKVEAEWNKIYPDQTIDYRFLDQTIERLYETELRTGKLMTLATGIAIVISCLGLFALSSFTVVQRTKEISIRKVLGSSVNAIVMLLSKDFLKYVIIAFIIAAPFAYYITTGWLEGFAYRIDPGIWIFIISGSLSVLTAFLTISFQTIRAAKANPVKFLRYE